MLQYACKKNSKVLIIDVDGQANCSRFFTEELKSGLDKALVNTEVSPETAICHTRYDNIDIITATKELNSIATLFGHLTDEEQTSYARRIAIGIGLNGKKDVLGMWVGENERAKFWANVLNNMRNRGVEDILIACTDNLSGFSQAIEAVFLQTDIQNCIIHQLRNSSRYVSYKDLKALMAELKRVYTAVDEESAMNALDEFAEIWDSKYPKISKSWRDNWANLSTYFKFPQELRKLIYTTNAIEGFNHQLKKVTKAKSVFPTDDSLFKMLYLAMKDITKKWTGRRQDRSSIYAQLTIYYGDRILENIDN